MKSQWGWIVERDTPWGSRGPPRALAPPPPPTTKSCRPSAASASPESARRTRRSQRDCKRHGNTEPAQCADARLRLPREHPQSPAKSRMRPKLLRRPNVLRHPPLLKTWFCLMLVLSGSKAGTDATSFPCTVSGDSSKGTQYSTAPGGASVGSPQQAVPTLRCSEHAKHSVQSSSRLQVQSSSQRGSYTQPEQEGDACPSWTATVPGTHSSANFSQAHMSNMQCLSIRQMVPGTPLSHAAMTQRRKTSININLLVRISSGYSRPLRPDLTRGPGLTQRFLPITSCAAWKTHFLVRTFTIFGSGRP